MTYRVVQLTDTHLFKDPGGIQKGVNTCETLRAVVAHVAANQPDFDALLLTGDLSQDETPESYDLLKQVLAPIRTAPVYAIPGNHDDPDQMQSRLAAEGFLLLTDARLGNWRIAMLNSRVPGCVHGTLGRVQLGQLAKSLQDTTEHTMIALHHPPVAVGNAWLDGARCLDGEELLAILVDTPAKAVVCGHVHQLFETSREGIAILTTPSTCVQFKPEVDEFAIDESAPPGYRVFELEANGRWSTTVHRLGGP